MARKLRIQYEGAIYHVMSRGNGKAAVFHNDVDRRSFVQTLAEACSKTYWQVHACCLMKTPFHLVVETPRSNLVPGMLLRQNTTMTIGWIADRLQMGTPGHLSHWDLDSVIVAVGVQDMTGNYFIT